MSSNDFKSSEKLQNNLTTTQTNKIAGKVKLVDQHAHPKQNFDHSETADIF